MVRERALDAVLYAYVRVGVATTSSEKFSLAFDGTFLNLTRRSKKKDKRGVIDDECQNRTKFTGNSSRLVGD